MPKFAAGRAEIRCRGRRQASLALAIGVTAVLSAAWFSGDGLERTRRQTAVARAAPARRSIATAAPSNAPWVPPVRAAPEAAAAGPEPAGRSRLRDLEAAHASLAAISESLRSSATLTGQRGGETFFLGGQTTLRGFDFRGVHADGPATQD